MGNIPKVFLLQCRVFSFSLSLFLSLSLLAHLLSQTYMLHTTYVEPSIKVSFPYI